MYIIIKNIVTIKTITLTFFINENLLFIHIIKVSKDGILKPETELKGIIDTLLYDESDSVYVGEVGERLELSLKIEKAIPVNSVYGKTIMHIMHDDCGNEFIWTTAAKSLTPGNEYLMRGTVKTHNKYKGVQQTVLTRCKIL